MSDLKSKIGSDTKAAMYRKDRRRVGVLRLINAAIKQIEVDTRMTVDDAGVLQVLRKMSKQRQESIVQYQKAERSDLLEQEEYELSAIAAYLPQPLADAEIAQWVDEAIGVNAAVSLKDLGAVMKTLRDKAKGGVDMGVLSAAVKHRLGKA